MAIMTFMGNTQANPSSLVSGVRHYQLDNGLIVLIKPSQKAKTISVHLGVRVGATDEGDRIGSGLSHFVEHMFFKGTEKRPVGTIEREIRDMGGYINAYTSHDSTVYYVNALSEYLEQTLDLMSDAGFRASFDAGELEKERKVILSEMRMNEDRLDRKALITLWQLSFRKHPYRHPVIGYPSLFKRTSREDLMHFYHENYVPNNMVLSIVGDIDVTEAEALVEKYFAPVPRGWIGNLAKPVEPDQLVPRSKIIYKEAQHARLLLGFPTVPLNHADSPALDVLGAILGGGASSRLNQKVKEEEDQVLSIGSYNASMDEHGLFTIQGLLLSEKLDGARESIRRQVDLIKETIISEEELAKAKNQYLADFYHKFESHSALSRELLTNEIYTGEYQFSEKFVQLIETTGREEVMNVAKKYFDWNKVSEVVLLPLSEKKNEKTASLADRALDVQVTHLPNGIKILTGVDKTSPTVSIQWAMRAGVLYEEENQTGISMITSKMLTKGTPSKDQAQISSKIEGWGGGLSSYSGLNSMGINVSVLSKHTEEALDLLAELVKESTFPEEEIKKAKELQIEAILAKEENVFAFAQDLLLENIYQTHPYRRDPLGTLDTVGPINRELITKFYSDMLVPDRSVISVMGDISPDEVRRWVTDHFQDLKKPDSDYVLPVTEDERIDKLRVARAHLPREQAVVMIAFNATRIDDPERYPFEVVNAVMSGSSGRLYRKIREEHGLSYVVNSDLAANVEPGWFALYASVKPGEAQRTLELLKKEVALLGRSGITQEELDGAKQRLKGRYEQLKESKDSLLANIASYELYGLGYDAWLKYPEKIAAVQLEDVSRVIKQFVDSERSVELIVEPASQDSARASVPATEAVKS